MSFFASNNKISITNTANATIFDTDWKQPAITSILSGTFNLPARAPISGTQVILHNLGSAPASPEFVLVAGRITGGSDYPWGATNFNSSGSVITNLGWNFTDTWRIGAARSISFIVQSGALFLREEYYNVFPTVSIVSFNIQYKAYLGRFT
jgi:hypothetical protein